MLDKNDFMPIVVIPLIPINDSTIRVFHYKNKYDIIGDNVNIVWKILAYCDGHNCIENIIKKTGFSKDIVISVLGDLLEIEVIIDSRKQYIHFHKISNYPVLFHRDLNDDEINKHLMSPRTPTKEGKIINFEKNTNSSLYEMQIKRTSCRSFSQEKLCLDEIANICYYGYSFSTHATPSGGGLYPLKIFIVIIEDQIDISKGYYEYDPERDILIKYSSIVDVDTLHYCVNSTDFAFNSQIHIIICADFKRQSYKYSNRGYRLSLIEAGQVAQNIILYCSENNISTCELGGILDEPIRNELNFDNEIYPLLNIAIGRNNQEKISGYDELFNYVKKEFVGKSKPVKNYGVSSFDYKATFFGGWSIYGNSEIAGATGKSSNSAAAKAIIEGYERYQSAQIKIDYFGSARDIQAPYISPDKLAPLSKEQAKIIGVNQFDNHLDINWTFGIRHSDNSKLLIPSDIIYYGQHNNTNRIVYSDSSGVAAYTDLEEAKNLAITELIERDAIMKTWLYKEIPQMISNDCLPINIQKRISYWKDFKRKIFIQYIESDYLPVIQVIIVSNQYPYFISGAAASYKSVQEAIKKAFSEAEYDLILELSHPNKNKALSPNNVKTPSDHGNLYKTGKFNHKIDFLLDGVELNMLPIIDKSIVEIKNQLDPIYVNLSDKTSKIKVVRALSENLMPISFGYGACYFLHPCLNQNKINTNDLFFPHYFS